MTRFLLLAPLALLACQQPSTNDATVSEEQKQLDAPVKDVETLPPDETAVVDRGNGTAAVVTGSTQISESLHGRWGLVPADCTSTNGDAKGLMRVSSDTLTFYESRATVDKVTSADPNRFAGQFGFTGEGQTWKENVTLTRRGDTLTREGGEQRLVYKRCA